MKVCPVCQKTYADDNLNFCLEDGTVLNQAMGNDAPPPTVMMSQPPVTSPRTTFGNQPSTQSSWNAPAQYAPAPKKSSKTWVWVLLILGVLVLVCGGGGVAFVALVYNLPPDNTNSNGKIVLTNKGNPPPTNGTTNKGNPPPNEKTPESLDLSKWVRPYSTFGDTEFTDGELRMSSKKKLSYYVVLGTKDDTTTGATATVTVRNVDGGDTTLGYGIIFHSDPETALNQDYAFLIDAKKKKYRVVRHSSSTETVVVAWTNSEVIKDGSQPNKLEIRDKGATTELYINDQMVTSIKNTYAFAGGVVGLYAADAVKVGFKDMQIAK